MQLQSLVISLAAALSAWSLPAAAQGNDPLRAAAEKAVATNPEVTARFNAYRAAADAVGIARGGFYPRLDLNASAGTERERDERLGPATRKVDRTAVGLSLTQLLWDGLGTSRDVDRLTHERLARYFDLLEATEQTVLEATRAQFDVQRFRRLVQLAEDSYVQHRYAFAQIQSRVKAGVGRGVDLEQAAARLALAESNLATEQANLHDVTARYLRVVGEAPPAQLSAPPLLKNGVPGSAAEAMNASLARSAAISASIESLRAVRSAGDGARSAYHPRVEARLRSTAGNNLDGVEDRTRNSTAEIVLNWNLFNGGSDQARVRQQVNLANQAADTRDKVCRDTRQVAAIAFNDTRKLTEQLVYLERNTLAIEKARDAYRQQFDIGQRSLLDLLNAENEVYTARRAYANAEFDLALAYARAQAAMSQLSTQLGIARVDRVANEAAGWAAGDDAPARCPADAAEIRASDRAALDARADALMKNAPTR